MSLADGDFLRTFYQSLIDRPLDPVLDEKLYVPLYAPGSTSPSDPVSELQRTVEWSPIESCQLFSGFRGTGKSTELRRLKRQLEAGGSVVVLCDMQRYLNLTTVIDVSDFLLAVAGAFGEELAKDELLLGYDVIKEGYWTRFVAFLTRTRVEVSGLGLSTKADAKVAEGLGFGIGGELKANLKEDPTFRQTLQQRLKGHLGALVRDVHKFFGECVKALRERHKDDSLRVVLLLDSVEQIRGTSVNAADVEASLEKLFYGHADALKIPYLHVVYTAPPWLKIKAPGVAGLYSGAHLIPCVKVQHKNDKVCREGLDELERIVAQRGDWRRLFGDDRAALDELLLASGGYLRDLFRLLQTVLRLARHDGERVSARTRALALDEVRNSYLPLANDDVRWLRRIQQWHSTQLETEKDLSKLSRFYDTHLVLTYRNGEEWVAVHPLVAKQVEQQAAELEAIDATSHARAIEEGGKG